MKYCIRKWLCLLICLLGLLPTTIFAVEVPDSNRLGSITITLRDGEDPVSKGSLKLWKVADVTEEDGNYSFAYIDEFTECEWELNDLKQETLSDGSLAANLKGFAMEKEIPGESLKVDEEGLVWVSNLTIGLYLIAQDEPADGYEPINPFLISVPNRNGETWDYDVDASPKCGTLTGSETTPPSTPPNTPPRLPQTGQLWWPVPLLAVSGLALLLLGWKRKLQ